MSGRAQISGAGSCQAYRQPLHFCGFVIGGRMGPRAESLMKTPVRAHGLGASRRCQGDPTCLGSAEDHTRGQSWAGLNRLMIPSGAWKSLLRCCF